MGEFTGHYNKCQKCNHIYDFNDICPECGSDEVEDISAQEVLKTITRTDEYATKIKGEKERLEEMLKKHDDGGIKINIEKTIADLVGMFLYYDRKEDEDLPLDAIEDAIQKGEITEEQIVTKFAECLSKGINK